MKLVHGGLDFSVFSLFRFNISFSLFFFFRDAKVTASYCYLVAF